MFRKAISSPACRRRRREARRCLARALVCRRPSGGLWVDSRISPKASDVSPNRGAFCRKDERKRAVIGRFWVEDDGPPSDESDKARAPVISNYMFGRLDRLWRCFVSDGRNWRERSAFMPRRRDGFVDQLPGKPPPIPMAEHTSGSFATAKRMGWGHSRTVTMGNTSVSFATAGRAAGEPMLIPTGEDTSANGGMGISMAVESAHIPTAGKKTANGAAANS